METVSSHLLSVLPSGVVERDVRRDALHRRRDRSQLASWVLTPKRKVGKLSISAVFSRGAMFIMSQAALCVGCVWT